jgi:8-oxo-dGTP pyrophosphatase MutT (NUDIX family)
MTERPRPFQILSTEIAWSCPWYRVRRDHIIMTDGRPGIYHVIEKADAIWIIPVTADGRIVMVYQYRHTVDDWCWEIPAGSVKPGQSLEEAAREELREEVGGDADKLEYISRFYSANGICNEAGHIFLATGVVAGRPRHEPAEVMTVHLIPVPAALAMARTHQITDGPSALALLLCAERLTAVWASIGGEPAS